MNIIPTPVSDNIRKNEIEQVQQKQQEYTFVGTFLRTRGLKLFSYDLVNGVLAMLSPEHNNIVLTTPGERGRLEMKRNMGQEKCRIDARRCIPFEALNMKSAEKRVRKYKSGELKRLCNLVYVRKK